MHEFRDTTAAATTVPSVQALLPPGAPTYCTSRIRKIGNSSRTQSLQGGGGGGGVQRGREVSKRGTSYRSLLPNQYRQTVPFVEQ